MAKPIRRSLTSPLRGVARLGHRPAACSGPRIQALNGRLYRGIAVLCCAALLAACGLRDTALSAASASTPGGAIGGATALGAKQPNDQRTAKRGSATDPAAALLSHRPAGPMQPRTPLPKASPAPTGTFFGLGPIHADVDKRKHHFYPGPKPPPRVGEVITMAVPPPGPAPSQSAPPVGVAGVVTVSRVAPQGVVGIINAVSAQFSQAMVPVASLRDLQRWPVPLRITPAVDAKARWLGTRTVVLESIKRLSFSTAFTAEVAAGTAAANGSRLAVAKRWTFETPRLQPAWRMPSGNQVRPETAIAVTFNQEIDADKIAKALMLRRGGDRIALALVPVKAWKTLPKLATRLAGADPKRTVVLRPTQLLAVASAFTVTLPIGAYSAEGPLPTKTALTWSFSTYPKLKISQAWCEYKDKRSACREGNPVSLRTTTQLDPEQELRAVVKITPEPVDLQIRVNGYGLSLTGGFEASSRYVVHISPTLRDVFGQTLGKAWTATFAYRDGEPVLQLPSTQPVVIEQAAGTTVHARVRNLDAVTLHLLPIGKHGLHAAHRGFGGGWQPRDKHPFAQLTAARDPASSRRRDKATRTALKTGVTKNKLGVVALNLKPGLQGRPSGVVAMSVSAPWPYNRGWFSGKTGYTSLLVQVTNIGITARWDNKRVVAYVATLSTGKPLGGARVELVDGKGAVIATGKSDDQGAVELPCTSWGWSDSRFLWVESQPSGATEVAFLRLPRQVRGPGATPTLRSFVWTDRSPYKPDEVAELSGLLRADDPGMKGGINAVSDARALSWKLRSARGIEVGKGEVEVSASGAFHVQLPLPADMDLGNAWFQAKIVGGRWAGKRVQHSFQVQHYRAPEFKVAAALRPGARQAAAAPTPSWLRFGEDAELEVSGRYYFGAAMGGAKAHYLLKRTPTRFAPPKHAGWAFGRAQTSPWRGGGGQGFAVHGHSIVAQGQGTLDAEGRWRIQHLLDPTLRDKNGKPALTDGKPGQIEGPASYTLETWVEDDARQRISARATATVHRGGLYAGLKLDKTVIEAGKELTLSVVAADVQGKRQGRAVQVRLVRLEAKKRARWSHAPRFGRGRPWPLWQFDEVEVGRCTATTTLTLGVDKRPLPATCKLTLPTAGQYRFIAQVTDDGGATTISHIEAYAFGKKRVRWAVRDMGTVELVPDKASYQPGETATVLIKSPFPAARGLLTVERNGLISWRLVDVATGASAVQVKLAHGWAPNVNIHVTLFSGRRAASTPRDPSPKSRRGLDPEGKPRSASGQLSLPIALSEKNIAVQVLPKRPVMAPGETLELDLETRDGHGKPVAAKLTVWAVDEGVLALLGFMTPNPLPFFHRHRAGHAAGDDLRARILVEQFAALRGRSYPRKNKMMRHLEGKARRGGGGRTAMRFGSKSAGAPVAVAEAAPRGAERAESEEGGADAPGDVGGGPAPALRQLFAATAFFRSGIVTDDAGHAALRVKLPDNTTTFRVMVVAEAAADQFGSGDGQFTTRQPVLLRAALPRFANLHDDFDAAAVLHNETGSRQTFVVGARGAGVSWHDTFEKTVDLDAGAATEVRFRVRATQTGRATFQFAARVKGSARRDYADAVQTSIPINLPATLEAFATYGSTTSSVKQPIQAPTDAIAGFGGLDVTLSSTALSGLEDATRYLIEYPYECAEQTASRLIPITLLGELLDQFQIGSVADRAKRDGLVNRAVKRLVGLQHYDGGFKFWPKARQSSRWVSPWVTYALLLAKQQGATVPPRTLKRANQYLRNLVRRSSWHTEWWRVSDTLSLWVLTHPANTLGPPAQHKQYAGPLGRLYNDRDKLPVFARAWLMTVAHRLGETSKRDELLRGLDNNVVEKAGTAHIVEGKSEDLRILMHSSDRTDAIVLGALVEVKPTHPLMSKLIRGLMDARVKGRWSTTQANAWALVGARRYFDVFERVTPNFATQLWLGDGFLGTQRFKGRSLAKAHAHVPMDLVTQRAQKDGRTAKTGSASGGGGNPGSGGKLIDLVLAKQGPGRMYYRLGLRYAPQSLRLPATEQGFTVQRTYEALSAKERDRVQQLPNGSWRIRAGTDVRVRLTVVVPTRAHYVVVDDPLPGGFEPQNPAFRTTSSAHQQSPNRRGGGGWHWYSWWRWNHIEMRDDRVLLFADRLWAGVYSHSYVARATSIGRFVVPPARAEEMYAPETFGRNATTFVEVVE